MSPDSSQDTYRRRELLKIGGTALATSLAGCSTDDSDGGNGYTPENGNGNGNGNGGTGYQPDPSIELSGSELVEADEGVYIATGETLEAVCDADLEELASTHLEVQGPRGSSQLECGEPYEFGEPGDYLFVLTAESEEGNTGEDSYSVEAMIPPEIQGIEATEPLTVREPNEIIYQITGTDIQTQHQVETPNNSEQYEGNTFTVTPKEEGEIAINTTAENPVGQDQLEKILEAEIEIDLEKNQKKRKEAVGLVSYPGVYLWYDTGLMNDLEPEIAEEKGIKPDQEWYLYMNGGRYRDGNSLRFEARKFDDISETDNLDDFYDLEDLVRPLNDSKPEEIERYKGRKVWRTNPRERWIVDSDNNFLFQTYDFDLETLIDFIDDGFETRTWLDFPLHKQGLIDNEVVIAEARNKEMFTEEANPGSVNRRAQVVDKEDISVTDQVYDLHLHRDEDRIEKTHEVSGIPTTTFVEDYNVPENLPQNSP